MKRMAKSRRREWKNRWMIGEGGVGGVGGE